MPRTTLNSACGLKGRHLVLVVFLLAINLYHLNADGEEEPTPAPEGETTEGVPTEAGTTEEVPTELVTTEEVPTELVTTEEVPTEIVTTEGVPTEVVTSEGQEGEDKALQADNPEGGSTLSGGVTTQATTAATTPTTTKAKTKATTSKPKTNTTGNYSNLFYHDNICSIEFYQE